MAIHIDLEADDEAVVPPPSSKRPRFSAPLFHGLPTELVHGDDVLAATAAAEAEWRAAHASGGGVWSDADFPAVTLSICGKEEKAAPTVEPVDDAGPPPAGAPPRCRCRAEAARVIVKSDTPNKGRAYFCCATRTCSFFGWVDGEPSLARSRMANLGWSRFSALHVVSDFGFRAQDLRQGGVGDCWYPVARARLRLGRAASRSRAR
jgi:hypothetical protein